MVFPNEPNKLPWHSGHASKDPIPQAPFWWGVDDTKAPKIKTNIVDTSLGLEFIKRLQPREFDWTSDYLDDLLDPSDKHAIVARDIYTNLQQGFIVDEVKQAVFDQTGSNNAFSGLTFNPRNKDELDTLDESNPVGYIRPTDFIPPLVKGVQELSAKIELLEARVDELEGV